MKRNPMNAMICMVVVLVVASVANAAPGVGDKAPDFELPGSDGKTYSLADFNGKQVVVLAWFPKAFTVG